MSHYFTHYWKNDTWEQERQATILGTRDNLEHTADNKFSKRGVVPGDFVYPVTVMDGVLYVMCKLEVGRVCDFDEAASIFGTRDLWDAQDHIVAARPAPRRFDLAVPLETARRLRFVSKKAKQLKFGPTGGLDRRTRHC
jgi:hypothetical protein